MTTNSPDIPFGRFALTPWRENLRRLAGRLPRNGFGKQMRSLLRRVVTAGASEPYDIEVFPDVRARVYPGTNLCEKRVFAAPQLYDWQERQTLSAALAASDTEPFVFVDLGANVGVYTLWMVSEARRLGRSVRVLAVEPDPQTYARLEMNLTLSSAGEATPVQCAVGASEGRGQIIGHADNRGQHRIVSGEGQSAESVAVVPLHKLCADQRIDRIDAMKVDLEGLDYDVLTTFFAGAPAAQWPRWIVVEVGKEAHTPVIDLGRRHGYRLHKRTRLNAILYKAGAGDETN